MINYITNYYVEMAKGAWNLTYPKDLKTLATKQQTTH